MPELPEVETVRKGLADRLANFQIQRIEVCRDRAIASPGGVKEFTSNMSGAFIGEWYRRGKYLFSSLHRESSSLNPSEGHKAFIDGGWWGIHLRMTGYFQWHEQKTSPCRHTRVRLWNTTGKELRFVDIRSFGQMWWVPPNNLPETVITGLRNLGPEPFSKEFNPIYLEARLKGKKNTIKSALLDQSVVAGTGNIYADESLFQAGILPNKPSGELNKIELKKLCSSLISVLKVSIGQGGTTFSDFRDLEGLNGNYGGQSWVYRKGGQPCRRCGTPILRKRISGRSTHWCPRCQN